MGVICTKNKNEQNVKAHYEFGNDPMECVLMTKQE
jgi:hypothetical protein